MTLVEIILLAGAVLGILIVGAVYVAMKEKDHDD